MRVIRVFNNNAIMAHDSEKGDVILLGSGIGFYVKRNDLVDKSKIEKIFVMKENSVLGDLIDQIPPIYLNLTNEIVKYAKTNHGIDCRDAIYLALTDHIYFALDGIKKGIHLENPYLIDIRHFYAKEYEVGLYARKLIKEWFNVDISDSEVGYITIHVIENSVDKEINGNFKQVFNIIEDTVEFLRLYYLDGIKTDSIAYSRLVTHVKFFAPRYVDDRSHQKKDEDLDQLIRTAFKEESNVVQALSKELEKKYGKEISVAEQNYLILHIRNCKSEINSDSEK